MKVPLLLTLLVGLVLPNFGAAAIASSPSGVCESCLIAVRVLEDALCDEGAVDLIVGFAVEDLCPALPNQEECVQLAQAILPVAVQWLRASTSPADLCSAMGVCGDAVRGDTQWNQVPARLTDGFECPVCKHVMGTVQRDIKAASAATTSDSSSPLPLALPSGDADTVATADVSSSSSSSSSTSSAAAASKARALLRASVGAACEMMPGELPGECKRAFEKRDALLALALGPPSDPRDLTASCELLGMCVGGLARRKAPPLTADLASHVELLRKTVHLYCRTAPRTVEENRCHVCKLTVLEVATLLANPAFQDSVQTYSEAVCDNAVPSSYSIICRQMVDTYMLVLMDALKTALDPDNVCVRMRRCPRPSLWQEIVSGVKARAAGLVDRLYRFQRA